MLMLSQYLQLYTTLLLVFQLVAPKITLQIRFGDISAAELCFAFEFKFKISTDDFRLLLDESFLRFD